MFKKLTKNGKGAVSSQQFSSTAVAAVGTSNENAPLLQQILAEVKLISSQIDILVKHPKGDQ
ncbi:hypothetical protein TSUD_96360 [Trifolium subterraneum]|nr:hypothetical protein TSUD_96360 [Trifolium subterraneum]